MPSKFYTANDSTALPEMDPTPCGTFTYGQHPIVIVEGFAGVSQATLEILTNGVVMSRETILMNSGHVERSSVTSTLVRSSPDSQVEEQDKVNVVLNAGAKVDLGAIAPGAYDLTLKTNGVVAATNHFRVNLPAGLETERQEIESEQIKLQQAADQLKQLGGEIERDRASVDPSNAAMVAQFNDKVTHYNQLKQKTEADEEAFNKKVQDFNDRMTAPDIQLTQQEKTGVGTGDAVLSITAPCAALNVPPQVLGFIANVVGAEACTIMGHRNFIEPTSLFRHITSLME